MPSIRLDRTRILDEALKLLEEGGLEALSLRQIAARLEVGTSTLYWHVRDKDALITGLSHRIFRSCLEAVADPATWEEWLRTFGRALWDAQVRIPDTRKLIVLARPDPEQRRATTEEVLEALEARGLPRAIGEIAQRSVQALVTGWTTLKEREPELGRTDIDSFEAALDALIGGWRRVFTGDRT